MHLIIDNFYYTKYWYNNSPFAFGGCLCMSEAIVLNQREQIVSGQRKRRGIATIAKQDPRSQTFTDADTDEEKSTSSL